MHQHQHRASVDSVVASGSVVKSNRFRAEHPFKSNALSAAKAKGQRFGKNALNRRVSQKRMPTQEFLLAQFAGVCRHGAEFRKVECRATTAVVKKTAHKLANGLIHLYGGLIKVLGPGKLLESATSACKHARFSSEAFDRSEDDAGLAELGLALADFERYKIELRNRIGSVARDQSATTQSKAPGNADDRPPGKRFERRHSGAGAVHAAPPSPAA